MKAAEVAIGQFSLFTGSNLFMVDFIPARRKTVHITTMQRLLKRLYSQVSSGMVSWSWLPSTSQDMVGPSGDYGRAPIPVREERNGRSVPSIACPLPDALSQELGTAKPSFTSSALSDGKLDAQEESDLKWSAASVYGGSSVPATMCLHTLNRFLCLGAVETVCALDFKRAPN